MAPDNLKSWPNTLDMTDHAASKSLFQLHCDWDQPKPASGLTIPEGFGYSTSEEQLLFWMHMGLCENGLTPLRQTHSSSAFATGCGFSRLKFFVWVYDTLWLCDKAGPPATIQSLQHARSHERKSDEFANAPHAWRRAIWTRRTDACWVVWHVLLVQNSRNAVFAWHTSRMPGKWIRTFIFRYVTCYVYMCVWMYIYIMYPAHIRICIFSNYAVELERNST